jgi:malate dehydrogenase (oxaloacetate-decarboxylating)(NADP+)
MEINRQEALDFHSNPSAGILETCLKKDLINQKDYSLAYTPGVAFPCKEIEKNPQNIYLYTNKSNLVAMISNGTAVLGLGDIGSKACKPVMENKAALLKKFGGVDCYDIEINEKDPNKFIEIVKAISDTFGAINLEDIKAPDCFLIENSLKESLDIPVMHDDQHGTAIISSAALLNSLDILGKNIKNISVVINGAGAAAIACANLYISLGVKKENITMLDSKAVINSKRNDLNQFKKNFISEKNINTLEEALIDADVFLGVSVANVLNEKMLKSMAKNPIIFALANPNPEVNYNFAVQIRPDAIVATGRSDFPNQVNNILGYPYIFRGALDVQAKKITEKMKKAAVFSISKIAKKEVPQYINEIYNLKNIKFGREYILPKMMDKRLLIEVSSSVAKAAIEDGVARKKIEDWDEYEKKLSILI